MLPQDFQKLRAKTIKPSLRRMERRAWSISLLCTSLWPSLFFFRLALALVEVQVDLNIRSLDVITLVRPLSTILPQNHQLPSNISINLHIFLLSNPPPPKKLIKLKKPIQHYPKVPLTYYLTSNSSLLRCVN